MRAPRWWRYSAYARQALREQFVYIERLLMWMFMVAMRIASQLFFWSVVFGGVHSVGGYTRGAMFTYICITNALIFLFSGLMDRKVVERIVDGSIAMDLVRPADLYLASVFSFLGQMAFQLLISVPPIVAAGVIFFGVRGPGSPALWALFLASILLGIPLWASIRWLFSLLVFWTETARGLGLLLGYLVQFLSGGLLPLTFFPAGIAALLYLLPFQAVVYTPTGIFTGTLTTGTAVRLVALEAFWVVALALASRACWGAAVRRLEVQGG